MEEKGEKKAHKTNNTGKKAHKTNNPMTKYMKNVATIYFKLSCFPIFVFGIDLVWVSNCPTPVRFLLKSLNS